jgi:hypothetical protein
MRGMPSVTLGLSAPNPNPLLTLATHLALEADFTFSYDGMARNAAEVAVDVMLWRTGIWQFMHMWKRHEAPYGVRTLIWKTDACTGADDRPFGWDCTS